MDDLEFVENISKCDPDDVTSASWVRLCNLARITALESSSRSSFTRGAEAMKEMAAELHDEQAANAKIRYESLNRYSDESDERLGWRSWKDSNDRHRSYAAAIRAIPTPEESA